jgi:hypothetical protein
VAVMRMAGQARYGARHGLNRAADCRSARRCSCRVLGPHEGVVRLEPATPVLSSQSSPRTISIRRLCAVDRDNTDL